MLAGKPDSSEQKRLQSVRALGLLDTGPEQEFDDLVELAAAICNVSIGLVTLLDERRQFHKARMGFELAELPRSVAFCEYTIQQDGVFVVEDAALDPRFSSNPLVIGKEKLRFYAGAPLTTSDGSKVGALCVLDLASHGLTAQQTTALALLARQVVARMELRQKRLELEAAHVQLRASEELFRAFANNIPFETYLKDAAGRFVFYNTKLAGRFGITNETWIGKTNSDIWPADLARSLNLIEDQVRAGMDRVEWTAETPNPDGSSTHWVSIQVPYRDTGGNLLLAGISIDVAEISHLATLKKPLVE